MYEEDFSNPPRRQRRRGFLGSRFFWFLVIIIVVCGIIGLLMSTLFAGASITVTPRSAAVAAPATMQAQINAPAGTLPYQVINSARTASTSVPATGTKQVSLSASGIATIYNAYSVASQDLVATTRFEAPDGKIYRIHNTVTVPGAKKQPTARSLRAALVQHCMLTSRAPTTIVLQQLTLLSPDLRVTLSTQSSMQLRRP